MRQMGERNFEKYCVHSPSNRDVLPTLKSSIPHLFPSLPTRFMSSPSFLRVTPAPCLFLAFFNLLPPVILVVSFLPLLYHSHPLQKQSSLQPLLSHLHFSICSQDFGKQHLCPVCSIRGCFTNAGLVGPGLHI